VCNTRETPPKSFTWSFTLGSEISGSHGGELQGTTFQKTVIFTLGSSTKILITFQLWLKLHINNGHLTYVFLRVEMTVGNPQTRNSDEGSPSRATTGNKLPRWLYHAYRRQTTVHEKLINTRQLWRRQHHSERSKDKFWWTCQNCYVKHTSSNILIAVFNVCSLSSVMAFDIFFDGNS
jgi:hypothetical protein